MTLPFLSQFNPETGEINGLLPKVRKLDSLKGYFVDTAAFERSLQQGNPVIYAVTSVEPASGDGQLHYGLGKLMPGKIGPEYYFTAGHFHAYRPAAEFYIGLSGEGLMLLQDEVSGATVVQPLKPNLVVYVPGSTAHRTVNCGSVPLTYLGVYPALAGHDYGIIAQKNFNQVVIEVDGQPVVMDRQEALEYIAKKR
jgi:glucose-6-phosphate isomerase, archaeal